MEKLLTVQEAALNLGLQPSTIYALVATKKIPFIKLGSRVLFSPIDLTLWIDSKKVSK